MVELDGPADLPGAESVREDKMGPHSRHRAHGGGHDSVEPVGLGFVRALNCHQRETSDEHALLPAQLDKVDALGVGHAQSELLAWLRETWDITVEEKS